MYKLSELAAMIGATLQGEDLEIGGISTLENATPKDVTFLANPRYISLLAVTKAGAVILKKEYASSVKNALVVEDPYHAFAKLLHLFRKTKQDYTGISEFTSIQDTVSLGNNVTIYPYVYIAKDVVIADDVVIYPHCYIGAGSSIGKGTILYPNVTILENTVIGENCIITSGAVIGSEGFGFIPTSDGIVSIPQIGTVVLKDDVYVGANTTIDRAAVDKTLIAKGTKIDNLVQIGHNVQIGEYCMLVAQTGISGSTKLGNRVITAGQAGIAGHLHIGDGAVVGPKAGIAKDIPPGETRAGMPATNQMTFLRLSHLFPKLPSLLKKIDVLEAKIAELESKIQQK